MTTPIFPQYYFCQVSKIRILQHIGKKYRAGSHCCVLPLPAFKASPLKFLPHGSDGDVNFTIIYIFYMELLDKKNAKNAANGN